MAAESILVVDDEQVLRQNLVRFLRSRGFHAVGAADGTDAAGQLEESDFALVLTDLRMPGMSGQELLSHVATHYPETMVLVMTAYASLETALEAMRMGAQDYILKPVVLEEVARRIENLLGRRELELRVGRLRREATRDYDTKGIVGSSPQMAELHRLVARVAPSNANVLLLGETGTGKELFARAIHDQSRVADREFIPVNLSALPADLVDATLFGHERGAFTGASRRREGVFRAANGGTVFLDEVGELPAAVQAKLLRVLENREVMPLGSDRPLPVSFRLVAATHRSLEQLAEAGAFRQDLYYRLAVFSIRVPPLRDRSDDIIELAAYFVRRHATTMGRHVLGLENEVSRRIAKYAWPGNVRELSNVIERAVLLAEGELVRLADLPDAMGPAPIEHLALKPALDAFRLQHVQRVLDSVGGDKEEAARLLEIHLATLYRHLGQD